MKLIQVTLIVLTAVLLFLYVNEGRIYHIARTLPFNSRGPIERSYEVGGLALLAVGILLIITARARYVVRIETDQGEVDALASPDRYRVERIVRAVERATASTT